jgi:uncharacterized protein DUF4326
MTTVINLRDTTAVRVAQAAGVFVRIDRATKWGNKYRVGVDGAREEVIAMHKVDTLRNAELLKAIRAELKDKTLGCWCAPRACHGHTYAAIADGRVVC